MRKILLVFGLILLTGCGFTPEEKMAKIDDIENAIYSTSKTLNLTNKDYEVLLIEYDEKDAGIVIQKRDSLYIKLMSTFLDPEEKLEIKNKIILFFQSIDSPPISSSVNIKEIKGKEYLDARHGIEKDSLFDTQTKFLFYEQLALLSGITFGLKDEFFLINELCSAVDRNRLEYTSALIDFSIDMFDPGLVRCIKGENYDMVPFTGNTVGMNSDSEVRRKLGVCPMSLRRISGRNAGYAISARISAWQYNVQQIDRDSIKSLDDAKDKIKRTFGNVPPVNPIPGSMNRLLDRHNKWAFGGNCSL